MRTLLAADLNREAKPATKKESACNTEDEPTKRSTPAATQHQSLQTEEYLMYQMIESQLKHVYENVNKLRAEDTSLKEKYRTVKAELKAEKTTREATAR